MADRLRREAIEIIPHRLYWADRAVGVGSPEEASWHRFSTDEDSNFVYEPFAEDFGPLSLGAVFRYCHMLEEMQRSTALLGKHLVHCCSQEPQKRANAACLICAYQVVVLRKPANAALRPFSNIVPPFVPFRDASTGPSSFDLTILDCLEGLERGIELGWFDWRSFDIASYENLAKADGCDANWIVPGKFLAFTGPSATPTDSHGFSVFTPEDCAQVFRRMNVGLVVRLNNAEYDRNRFTDRGVSHVDLYFTDGSCPSEEIVSKFFRITEAEPRAIAVHCKAGLGRTCTLIGLYTMKRYCFPARALIGWCRLCRPGSVLGPQQQFLVNMQDEMFRAGLAERGPSAASSPSRSLQAAAMEPYLWSSCTTPPSHAGLSAAHSPPLAPALGTRGGGGVAELFQRADLGQGERLCSAKRHHQAGGGSAPASPADLQRQPLRGARSPAAPQAHPGFAVSGAALSPYTARLPAPVVPPCGHGPSGHHQLALPSRGPAGASSPGDAVGGPVAEAVAQATAAAVAFSACLFEGPAAASACGKPPPQLGLGSTFLVPRGMLQSLWAVPDRT